MGTDGREGAPPFLSDRRRFLKLATVGGAAIAVAGPIRSQLDAFAASVVSTDPLDELGPPDEHGVRLPPGFVATLVAVSGDSVGATGYRWHAAPDGGACFPIPGAIGHTYVSNSEVDAAGGGVSSLSFSASGEVRSARSILTGSSRNCAGGATPWGTWLSCEENGETGRVWECDPGGAPARVLPGLGRFNHEAAAVDPIGRQVFLTEDEPTGRLYRFRPDRWPDLAAGSLDAAVVDGTAVSWVAADAGKPDRSESTAMFDGGEGAVVDGRSLLFTTKGDRRIWELGIDDDRLTVFHDCRANSDTPLTHVDNIAVHPVSGHIVVAEDGGDMDLCMLVRSSGGPIVSRLVRFVGHDGSEVAGPAFSPDGRFLYLSSQRGRDGRGMTFQIRGPFPQWIASIEQGAVAGAPAVRAGTARPVPGRDRDAAAVRAG